MELLQAGTDPINISLWMGHESPQTTQMYLNASLELKEKILAKVKPHASESTRYGPHGKLLTFLDRHHGLTRRSPGYAKN